MNYIQLKGVKTHNLKDITVNFPLGKFTVVSGVSGSGKSSLVFDTLYAESYRRYLESLSSFARQFMKSMPRPAMFEATNLPCAISVKQSRYKAHSKATVASLSQIAELLANLFCEFSVLRCLQCGADVRSSSPEVIFANIINRSEKAKIVQILAPLSEITQLENKELKNMLLAQGFTSLLSPFLERVDLENFSKSLKNYSVVVDRLHMLEESRFLQACTLAYSLGKGELSLVLDEELLAFSLTTKCVKCKIIYELPQVENFLSHHPLGACPKCLGAGLDESFEQCSECMGQRLNSLGLSYFWDGLNIAQMLEYKISDLYERTYSALSRNKFILQAKENSKHSDAEVMAELNLRLTYLEKVGLGYLQGCRGAETLSPGELQRLHMTQCLGSGLSDTLFCLDEPTAGLHPSELENFLAICLALKKNNNTVVCVSHDPLVLQKADHLIVLGPKAGGDGGEIVYSGPCILSERSISFGKTFINEALAKRFFVVQDIFIRNLQIPEVKFYLGALNVICGVSGSGKTTLAKEAVYAKISSLLGKSKKIRSSLPRFSEITLNGLDYANIGLQYFAQKTTRGSMRSNVATYLGIFEAVRKILASTTSAKECKLTAQAFSFNQKGGRCELCEGLGQIEEDLSFLGTIWVSCPHCQGEKFSEQVLTVRYRGKNITDILALTVQEAGLFFYDQPKVAKVCHEASSLGLAYLCLGQSSKDLSGGELQRLRLLSYVLSSKEHSLFFFDEPSLGLSIEDTLNLVAYLYKILGRGHTLIVIDHNLEVIRNAEHLIEVGPGAAARGGKLIFQGSIDKLSKSKESIIRKYLGC